MSKLDATDIQGFVLRGYALPFARYMFLEIVDADRGQAFIGRLLDQITTGEHWDAGKPEWTLNIAFTHRGLVNLKLPDTSLLSFPVEFLQGMKARGEILGDTGEKMGSSIGTHSGARAGSTSGWPRIPKLKRRWTLCVPTSRD